MVGVQRLYLLSRGTWRLPWGGSFHRCESDSSVPLEVFATREKAEARRRELEAVAHHELSPFLFGDLNQLSRIDEEEFSLEVDKLGLPPPQGFEWEGRAFCDWSGWWDILAGDMTDDQRAGVWDLLDKLNFYTITVIELEE